MARAVTHGIAGAVDLREGPPTSRVSSPFRRRKISPNKVSSQRLAHAGNCAAWDQPSGPSAVTVVSFALYSSIEETLPESFAHRVLL